MKFYSKAIFLFTVTLVMLTAIIVGCSVSAVEGRKDKETTTKVETKAEKQVKAISVDAKMLSKAFDENEIKANGEYKDKLVRIIGKVSDIGEILGKTYITLKSHKDFSLCSVQCYFVDELEIKRIAELKKGDSVVVGGVVEGKSINVTVNECEFLDQGAIK